MWYLNIVVVCGLLYWNPATAQSSCQTPNGDTGECTSIYSCQTLLSVVRTTNSEQLRFLRESQCGYSGNPLVCCGRYNTYHEAETSDFGGNSNNDNNEQPSNNGWQNNNNNNGGWNTDNDDGNRWGSNNNNNNRWPSNNGNRGNGNRRPGGGTSSALPTRATCGRQSANKILNGELTTLDEFPWMALLQYRKRSGGLTFACGGTLISSRFVLTAAHCVKGQILTKIGPLVNVRLGEWDTDSDEDCVDQLGFQICNDPPVDISVDRTIPHSGYSDGSANRYDDIALVKLQRSAPYSNFVRPICLPRGEASSIGDTLIVAGWGKTEYSNSSPRKLKLKIPVFPTSQCSSRFRTAGVTLGKKQICAGGERGKDSCNGDSGGPLMTTTKNDSSQWYLEGVVSFGARCGTEGWPGIYSKVSSYVDWIEQNVDA